MAYDQDKVGVMVNFDGTLQILSPAPEVMIADEFARLGITSGHIVLRSNKPATTKYFKAWRLNFGEMKIFLDLSTLKEMVIEDNEQDVKDQLLAMKPAFEEAYDNDDFATLAVIKSDRKNIRDTLTAKIAAINAATTESAILSYAP